MSVMEDSNSFRRFTGITAILAISYANAVYLGLWNPLEMILGGAWWLM